MKCPKCAVPLVAAERHGIAVDYCGSCKGMWLDAAELDQLEDQGFDIDPLKGTLAFKSSPTGHSCPHCAQPLRTFEYRKYALDIEFCGAQHGFWLDECEEERVLEIMRRTETDLARKYDAEDQWVEPLRRLRSRSFLDQLLRLFEQEMKG